MLLNDKERVRFDYYGDVAVFTCRHDDEDNYDLDNIGDYT